MTGALARIPFLVRLAAAGAVVGTALCAAAAALGGWVDTPALVAATLLRPAVAAADVGAVLLGDTRAGVLVGGALAWACWVLIGLALACAAYVAVSLLRRATRRLPLALTVLLGALVASALLAGGYTWARRAAHASIVYRLPTHEKVVALTFDDGPDLVYTPKVLDILEREQVPAMFFVVGQRAGELATIDYQREGARFLLCSHTHSHPKMRQLSAARQIDEFGKGEADLYAASRDLGSEAPSPYYRAPRGQISPLTLLWLRLDGGRYVGWSLAYDRKKYFWDPDRERRIAHFVRDVRPGDIILMHDGSSHAAQLVTDLPLIIDALKAKGYRFATLDDF